MTGKTSRALRAAAASLAAFSMLASITVAMAQNPQDGPSRRTEAVAVGAAVAEAAQRFALPEAWIHAVIQQESGGRTNAVSPKGAMGVLQLMPATWRELTREMGLGNDPYDVRANVIAGSAYLRRMYDRFGSPGFLAAYNAGPERYSQYLFGARPLPRETREYIQVLAPMIGARAVGPMTNVPPGAGASDLFVRSFNGEQSAMVEASSSPDVGGLWP